MSCLHQLPDRQHRDGDSTREKSDWHIEGKQRKQKAELAGCKGRTGRVRGMSKASQAG